MHTACEDLFAQNRRSSNQRPKLQPEKKLESRVVLKPMDGFPAPVQKPFSSPGDNDNPLIVDFLAGDGILYFATAFISAKSQMHGRVDSS
jgi:hypothetical protein